MHPDAWDGSALVLQPGVDILHRIEPLWRQISLVNETAPPEVATTRLISLFSRAVEIALPTQAILQTAIPHCIALQLSDSDDGAWITVADLTASDGRVIPEWMAEAVVKRGMKAERLDVIEILYGTAALAGLPPVKAVQVELGVPHRTAADWIYKARAAGRLEGMSYTPGRQADG
ncbi:hypothetical protein MIC448_980010 [Microbacterium sp. C448]|uniref:hypothetical protein n=1 Tax=Microbacterium sp. C448 TaxID=1177594 RepID=UPI0003DE0578|nr:hypothetical protein [Microbacterium sp. C448]CDK02003.1 hypothetical protein MIC448_980010 [Microbacterium sp. C448]